MRRQKHKQYLGLLALIGVIALVGGFIIWHRQNRTTPAANVTTITTTPPAVKSQAQPKPTDFDKTQLSLIDSASLWVIVNKHRPLSDGYIPAKLAAPNVPLRLSAGSEEMKLRADTGLALKALFADAQTAGYQLLVASGYRSQATQKSLHSRYVAQSGAAAADASSARAGFSEHQTGLAVDVGRTDHKCEIETCFGQTPDGQWLAANAHKYGFVLRYPDSKQPVTGYIYEPWHFRFVGQELAQAVRGTGQTLEEFFGLPAAPDYQ